MLGVLIILTAVALAARTGVRGRVDGAAGRPSAASSIRPDIERPSDGSRTSPGLIARTAGTQVEGEGPDVEYRA